MGGSRYEEPRNGLVSKMPSANLSIETILHTDPIVCPSTALWSNTLIFDVILFISSSISLSIFHSLIVWTVCVRDRLGEFWRMFLYGITGLVVSEVRCSRLFIFINLYCSRALVTYLMILFLCLTTRLPNSFLSFASSTCSLSNMSAINGLGFA